MALSNEYVTELYAALVAFDGTELTDVVEFNHDECAGSFNFEEQNSWLNYNCSPAWGVFMNGGELTADGVTEISIECGDIEVYLPYILCGDIEKDVANYFNILKGWIAENL